MSDAAPFGIGYLVQQFSPEVGAGPARVAEMARRWREASAAVTVVTAMPNRPAGRIHEEYRGRLFAREEADGLRVLRSWLYASPKYGFGRTIANNASFMATGALHALTHADGIQVLIASSPPFFPHIAGYLVSRVRRVPLVLEVRDLWPDYLVGMGVLKDGMAARALFALERFLLKRAAHVVVVTESFRQRVIQKGVRPERVSVIANGVDTRAYYPDVAAEPPLPSLARAPGEFLVGYLGNMGAGQDLTQVIRAAALTKDDASLRWVLAGDGAGRAEIEAMVRDQGLGNVSIHPPIAKDATRAFYNACDVCLVPLAPFPILQETVPSKIFEVMACERPVLAALGGEGASIVQQSGAGEVVPPGEPERIAEAVLRLRAAPPERLREMGAAGRHFVEANFARDRLAERYLELLKGVVAEWRP